MVDTINPSTGMSDNFSQNQAMPVQSPSTGINPQGATNYFAGFSKPDDIKVNLADDGSQNKEFVAPTAATVPVAPAAPAFQPNPAPAAAAPSFKNPTTPPPTAPTENVATNHTAYSANTAKTAFNWQAILFLAGSGLAFVAIVSIVTYLIVGNLYNKKLADAKANLSNLQTTLQNEQKTPSPLALPKAETPTPTAPQPAPQEQQQVQQQVQQQQQQEQQIQTPAPSVPSGTGQG